MVVGSDERTRNVTLNMNYFSRHWQFGSCFGPKHDWHIAPMQTYHDRCCLSPGEYSLTCLNTKREYGWGNAYLEIDGNRYCDDFVGFKAIRKVSIKGNISYLNL